MWAGCQARSLPPLLGKGDELQSLGVSLTELGDIDPSGPTPSETVGPTFPTSPPCLKNMRHFPTPVVQEEEGGRRWASRTPPAV